MGQWYPTKLLAYFNGAVGVLAEGISGKAGEGATAVVVTPGPTSHDEDMGDVLAYGVPIRYRKNAALRTSQKAGLPIRVLRSSRKSGRRAIYDSYAPTVGIRYDGLYTITTAALMFRDEEKYIRYVLMRLEDQPSLDEIVAARPTAEEKEQHREYTRIFERVSKA